MYETCCERKSIGSSDLRAHGSFFERRLLHAFHRINLYPLKASETRVSTRVTSRILYIYTSGKLHKARKKIPSLYITTPPTSQQKTPSIVIMRERKPSAMCKKRYKIESGKKSASSGVKARPCARLVLPKQKKKKSKRAGKNEYLSASIPLYFPGACVCSPMHLRARKRNKCIVCPEDDLGGRMEMYSWPPMSLKIVRRRWSVYTVRREEKIHTNACRVALALLYLLSRERAN